MAKKLIYHITFCFILFLLLGRSGMAQSSIYYGGNLAIQCKGSEYAIDLNLYTSCGLSYDGKLFVTVRNSQNEIITSIGNKGKIPLWLEHSDPITLKSPANECDGSSEERCYHFVAARSVIKLPFLEGGYFLSFDGCCDINNDKFRLEAELSEAGQTNCNKNAKYVYSGPDLVCQNKTTILPFDIYNNEGDELQFEIVESSFSDPSEVSINEATGALTVRPNKIGEYQVLVRINEFRNGDLIGYSLNTLAIEAFDCSGGVDISFLPDVVEICSNAEVNINPDGPTDLDYLWTPEEFFDDPRSANPTLLVDSSTVIRCEITDPDKGCSSSKTITVTSFDNLNAELAWRQECGNTNVLLYRASGPSEETEINWYVDSMLIGSGDSLEYDFSDFGFYELSMEIKKGDCSLVKTSTINVISSPSDIQDTLIACTQGDMIELNPNFLSGYKYAWTGPGINDPTDPNPTVNARDGATYKAIAVSDQDPECNYTIEIFVMTMGTANIVPAIHNFCDGSDSYTIPDSARYDEVTWISPSGKETEGPTIYLEEGFEMGMYTVRAKIGDCVIEDNIEFMGEMVTVQHTPNSPLCSEDIVTVMINSVSGVLIDSVVYTEMGNAVMVAGPNIESMFRITETTTFKGIVYLQGGCTAPFVETVEVMPGGNYSIEIGRDTLLNGEETTISISGATGGETYSWEPDGYISSGQGTNQITISPINDQVYTVTITDANGCMFDLTQPVTVIDTDCNENTVFVPNAFTPNGDNINDFWCIYGKTIDRLEVSVFDRWGKRLYQSNDKDECWDGTFDGTYLNSDVYVYHLKVYCLGGAVFEDTGNITLLK